MGAVYVERALPILSTQNTQLKKMSSEEAEQIYEYRSALRELVRNEKTRITFLTMTAHDNAAYARSIVKCIENHIKEAATPDLKLLGIFLVDSIIKNDEKGTYKSAFSTCIIPLFEHVFKSGNEAVRKSLYKVRLTWQEPKEQFPKSRLVGIDMKCNELDPKWPMLALVAEERQAKAALPQQTPVIKPNSANGKESVMPKVDKPVKAPVSNEIAAEIEIEQLLKKREQIEKKAMQSQDSSLIKPPVPETASTSTIPIDSKSVQKQKKRKKEAEIEYTNAECNDSYKIPKKKKSRDLKVKFNVETENDDVDLRKQKKLDADAKKPKRNAADSITSDKDTEPQQIKPPPKLTQPKPDFKSVSGENSKPMIGAPTLGHTAPLDMKPTPFNPNFSQSNLPQPPLHIASNLPANNKVHLDGKPYEVKYINDIAIVEKDSLPHRVHFKGLPKQIFIDGQPHNLAFNSTLEIIIDGTRLPIRFGAPGRELYIGGHPFRAAFGGSPIIATINHRRHEIRIGGPPPEVQIEPEPAHELTRFLNGGCAQSAFLTPLYSRANQQPLLPQPMIPPLSQPVVRQIRPSISVAPVSMPAMVPQFGGITQVASQSAAPAQPDVGMLLNKLKNSGVLNMAMLTKKQPSPTPQELPPPIPASTLSGLDEEVERDYHAPATIKTFSSRVLRIRYHSVIDSLYSSQRRCNNCGLRFDNVDHDRYSRHLDAHFRDSQRQKREQNSSVSRPWYLAADDWLVFSVQQSEEEAAQHHAAPVTQNDKDLQSEEVPLVEAPAADAKISCKVCEEELEIFWHEDDEKWMLRNAIRHGDIFYHPTCFADLSQPSANFGEAVVADLS